MNQTDQNNAAVTLRIRRQIIQLQIGGMLAGGDLHIQPTAEETEQISSAVERHVSVKQIGELNKTLTAIRIALFLIDRGEYGSCVECERDIHAKRLEAVPWAIRCVKCQEKYEEMVARGEAEEDTEAMFSVGAVV